MHSARALWSIGVRFGFAYVAPSYLEEDIEKWAKHYGAMAISKIGTISRCPNVVIVGEGKEIGSQQYEYLLRKQSQCDFHGGTFTGLLNSYNFSDFLAFRGGFPFDRVLKELSKQEGAVTADINFVENDLSELPSLGRRFSNLILSTSSELFFNTFGGNPGAMVRSLSKYAESILLKENRGGSRLFSGTENSWISAPAFICPVVHSVGVGDFFDAIFVAQSSLHEKDVALTYASYGSAEYASYFDDQAVQESMTAVLAITPQEIRHLAGVQLPWETREKIHIYLAAPDFDYVDTRQLDVVEKALHYHNFSAHRPVREHGQARSGSQRSDRRQLAEADVALLSSCQLLVAVMLFDDPGTLIEIGLAIEQRKPVIVFDPLNRVSNLMLTELPILVTPNLDKVLIEVFIQAGKILNDKR